MERGLGILDGLTTTSRLKIHTCHSDSRCLRAFLVHLDLGFLAALVKAGSGAGEESGEVLFKISNKVDVEKVLGLWEKTERLYRETTLRYLDKKQVLVNSFLELGIC